AMTRAGPCTSLEFGLGPAPPGPPFGANPRAGRRRSAPYCANSTTQSSAGVLPPAPRSARASMIPADRIMQRRTSTTSTLVPLTLALGFGLGACEQQTSPFLVDPPTDCSVECQNQFVLDVMDDFYLWTADIPADIDISAYESPEELVKALRQGDDRWTSIRDKATSDALFMEGKFVGLGFKSQRGADNEVRISFVSDNSPASSVGIERGDVIVGVGGVSAEELNESGWSGVYGDDEPGVTVTVDVAKISTGEVETVTMTKDWINIVSLPVAELLDGPGAAPVGYFIMDKFVET